MKQHPALETAMADLVTFRALPTPSLPALDPFLFLNHHGPQVYPPQNQGLPFGPHPHKGFETLTFVFDGEVAHSDSTGQTFVTGPGGVQWMTAGRGIEHEEVSPDSFKEHGGPLEIIQVWMNLPARLKRSEPWYRGYESEELLHALVLFCHGEELREPVVACGPFVMNTEDEIREAYAEYQAGEFGRV